MDFLGDELLATACTKRHESMIKKIHSKEYLEIIRERHQ